MKCPQASLHSMKRGFGSVSLNISEWVTTCSHSRTGTWGTVKYDTVAVWLSSLLIDALSYQYNCLLIANSQVKPFLTIQ